MRNYSWSDKVVSSLLSCMRTLHSKPTSAKRESPAALLAEPALNLKEMQLSASLMRVNHTGEVCAQALYLGQGFVTQDPTLKKLFNEAALEEADHLEWCKTRITELQSHTSYLDPFWFTGSLLIGTCAGLFGNRFSLGFLAETENQVFAHLASHLEQLPKADTKSRKIVKTMQDEEAAHAKMAIQQGGSELPLPVKEGMRLLSKVMTKLSAIL